MIASEDIILWSDDAWCFGEDLEGMTHRSDDFRIIPFDTTEWHELYGLFVPTCQFCGYFDCVCGTE